MEKDDKMIPVRGKESLIANLILIAGIILLFIPGLILLLLRLLYKFVRILSSKPKNELKYNGLLEKA